MRHAVLAVFFLLAAGPLAARDIKVAADGSGDYTQLRDALAAAKPGDRVEMPDIASIGIAARKDGKILRFFRVIKRGAADRAGIEPGARVLRIDGEDVGDLDLFAAMTRIHGKAGTRVKLEYLPPHSATSKTVEITREARDPFKIEDDGSRYAVAEAAADDALAADLAEAAAAAGNHGAEIRLAFDYRMGRHGRRLDNEEAAKWATRAAEGGNPAGMRMLGFLYMKGLGVKQDYAEGFRWSEKAYQKGDASAAYNLGLMYLSGQGVAKDAAKAVPLLEIAAQSRVTDADKALAKARAETAKPGSVSREDVRVMMSQLLDEYKQREKPHAEKTEASDVDAPSYKRTQHPDDLAVVVGIQKYANIPEATFAENDADAVRAHFAALGVPERNIFFLKGAQATKSAFTKELEARLPRMTTAKSTVYFYFSGHGAPNPKSGDAYLMPYDGDPEFLDETGYPLKRLYAKLAALPAKRVIVALDSCFSGAGGRSVLAKGVRPLVTKVDAGPKTDGRVIAMTAASGSQISGTFDEQGHGLFTYYFLKGLNEGAKTLGDLQAYVKPRVGDEARRHNRDQTPQLIGGAEVLLAP